jgi:ribonuclease H / adenosylcobalamin/alpha-ribazole phosphatase
MTLAVPEMRRPDPLWPEILWIVRHGESAANLSSRQSEASGSLTVPLSHRDMDCPLSALGEAQAAELGQWFTTQTKPEIIIASPYVRTRQTTALLCAQLADDDRPQILFDERLRERERGVFDGLTKAGVAVELPYEHAKREFLGKFYHRAPGGESWCDVAQRLRSFTESVLPRYAGQRVMIIAHEVVIYCLRYIIEEMDEAQILAIDAASDIANGSVTEYHCQSGDALPRLIRFNGTAS